MHFKISKVTENNLIISKINIIYTKYKSKFISQSFGSLKKHKYGTYTAYLLGCLIKYDKTKRRYTEQFVEIRKSGVFNSK